MSTRDCGHRTSRFSDPLISQRTCTVDQRLQHEHIEGPFDGRPGTREPRVQEGARARVLLRPRSARLRTPGAVQGLTDSYLCRYYVGAEAMGAEAVFPHLRVNWRLATPGTR